MGELFAILSMTLFSTANIMINRGAVKGARSRGAFLSIIVSTVVATALWLVLGAAVGFPEIRFTGVAWFALAGMLTMLLGRVFLYASIQSIGAIRASAVKRLNPVFSVMLGVSLLGDTISGGTGLGMLLVFASFAVLVHQTLSDSSREPGRTALQHVAAVGYLYGPVSALAYAFGYVARKQGLDIMPDAIFGTMVGAWVGLGGFVVLSRFIPSYRDELAETFTTFRPWLIAAGLAGTLGQICYFVALQFSTVSRIALITSTEVFLTMFLSVLVFGNREKISREIVFAAVLGVAGAVVIILAGS